jgi:uncharacterized membrane protein
MPDLTGKLSKYYVEMALKNFFLKSVHKPVFWAIVITVIYITVTLFITLEMHDSYNTGAAFDLGTFTQELKSTLHGTILYSPSIGESQFSIHFSPVLFLLVPVYWVFPYAQMLIVVEVLLLALGGFLIYLIAREYHYSPRASLILEGLYFLNPLVWGVALYDFHEANFAIPALLLMLLGMKRKNWILFISGLVIALATKEDVVLTLGVFGAVLIIFDYWQHKKIEKTSMIIFCSAILTYCAGVIVSRIVSGGQHVQILSYITIRYAYIGEPLSIAVPLALQTVFSTSSLFLIGAYLSPLGFLPLLSPKLAIPALFVLLEGVLSTNYGQHNMLAQYPAAAVPFLFVAFMEALPKLRENQHIQKYINNTKIHAAAYSVIFLVLISVGVISEGIIQKVSLPDEHAAAIDKVIALVPDNVTVTAGIQVLPHLCCRTDAYMFGWEGESIAPSSGILNGVWGFPDQNTQYFVVDTRKTIWTATYAKIITKQYTLVTNIDGVLLYRLNP